MKKIPAAVLVLAVVSGLGWLLLNRPGPASVLSPDAPPLVSSPVPGIPAETVSPTPEGVPQISSGSGAPEAALPPEDQRKLSVLSEILETKNDNDPRMDTELQHFSKAGKHALQSRYSALKPEKRNARGTVVFLLGRELESPEEAAFLGSVLQEKPCLSLQDCDRPPESHGGAEEHLEALNETSANYPQLMALRALRSRASDLKKNNGDPALISAIEAALRDGERSSNPRVAEEAARTLKEFFP